MQSVILCKSFSFRTNSFLLCCKFDIIFTVYITCLCVLSNYLLVTICIFTSGNDF